MREIITNRYYVGEVIELYDEEATTVSVAQLFARPIEETQLEDSVFLLTQNKHFRYIVCARLL